MGMVMNFFQTDKTSLDNLQIRTENQLITELHELEKMCVSSFYSEKLFSGLEFVLNKAAGKCFKNLFTPQWEFCSEDFSAPDFLKLPPEEQLEAQLDAVRLNYIPHGEVIKIHSQLDPLNEEHIRLHYDPHELNRSRIYPEFWTEQLIEELTGDFKKLKSFLAKCRKTPDSNIVVSLN